MFALPNIKVYSPKDKELSSAPTYQCPRQTEALLSAQKGSRALLGSAGLCRGPGQR